MIGNKKNICIFLYSLVLFKIVFIFMENIIRGEKGNLLGYYMFLFIKEFFRWWFIFLYGVVYRRNNVFTCGNDKKVLF